MERDYIHLGDCYDMLAALPEGQIDAVITDPPYGITQCEWDTAPDLDRLFRELWRVLKPNGALLMFAQQPFATDCINASRKQFRYEWVWEKSVAVGFFNASRMPLKCHENILTFYRHLPTYNPLFSTGGKPYFRSRKQRIKGLYHGDREESSTDRMDGKRCPRSVIHYQSVSKVYVGRGDARQTERGDRIHPTQKPLPLLEYLIKTYTNEGETVLDPFMGAATTAVAALRTGRHWIGAELMPDYHAKALDRIERHRQQMAAAEIKSKE